MSMTLTFHFAILFVVLFTRVCLSYKPVILLHGIFSAHEEMEIMANYITTAHPGTVIHNIALFENISSADTSLWTQLHGIVDKIRAVLENDTGVHMVCHSQGKIIY